MPILLIDNNSVHINIPVTGTQYVLDREWAEGEAKAHATKAMFAVSNCASYYSAILRRKSMVIYCD